ncbi:diacylglycerol/lipid kinase family protein [Pseudaminobacter sp. NGMCC 1.201702]|uniref:diacylglycerol/lipid kinase family protein n=1 Tax=Pseudaminobacter sp. NGMCC 1.201702 TaxID=3391825 RepID=UPI0039F11DED
MKTFVVVNPRAGGGRARRDWPTIERRLRAAIGLFHHAETTAPGHATTLTRQAILGGANQVIAVGGDGTLNETINGFTQADGSFSSDVCFGAIAVGTGSDFVRSLATSASLAHLIGLIAAGNTRRIDIGRMTFADDQGNQKVRLFANIASFGISGQIDRAVNAIRDDQFIPRKILFLGATVRALMKYKSQRVRMIVDNRPAVEAEIAVVAIANGRYFGGGMLVAPDAELDDGLFDVVTIHAASKLVLLRDLQMIYGGRHCNHPSISIQRARQVTVEALDESRTGPVLLDVDGESPGKLWATYDIRAGALKLLC